MSIEKSAYSSIIQRLKIGNSVAEHDSLLEEARVETPIFSGVLNDQYDVVVGRKGAGKTAMFKLINRLSSYMHIERNIIVLSGVNSSGESIFNEYKDQFSHFTERDFETFWKFYFIHLVYNEFIKDDRYQSHLIGCEDEIKKFLIEFDKAGIPTFNTKQEKREILKWLVSIFSTRIKKAKIDVTIHTGTPGLFTFSPEVEFESDSKDLSFIDREAVYIEDITKALKVILAKSELKIWIILDRLDEVFDRYSSIEFNGLRGLFIAYKSFVSDEKDSDLLRIKLFLRDDIVDFLTNNNIYKKYFKQKNIPPLPAATHIFAKQSPVLNWSEDEIEQLILNRLLLNKELKNYVGLNEENDKVKEMLRVKANRQLYWDKIFPVTISNSKSIKWIFTRLKDANGVVTPRSVIDMLEAATIYQRKKMSIDFEDCEYIFPVDSIKEGLAIASKNKLEKDIYNEFPKEQDNIKKLSKEGKIKLSKTDLERIYGKNWEDIIASLIRIGIVRFVKDSNSYRVEFIFRPALGLAYSY